MARHRHRGRGETRRVVRARRTDFPEARESAGKAGQARMNANDPLHLALSGIHTIEANAGTGKTFTIAQLYLRLVLEQGLAADAIVVATFTRAATAELSERLRDWLALAARQLAGDEPGRLREGETGATKAIREVLQQAHACRVDAGDANPWATLSARARAASQANDTAQISTLHAFCFRVLGEFGFETGSPLQQAELIEDTRALDLEIVRDFWRRRGAGDATSAALLDAAWGNPETLAKQVADPRWDDRVIDLPGVTADTDPETRVARAKATLLHEARECLVKQRRLRLASRNRISHDGAVQRLRAALAGAHAQPALEQIRRRWKAALVDEFQDTDEAQWDIVRALFGKGTLFLVGDPKQAIYGFRGGDVYAWRKATAAATPPPLHLTTSYRAGTRLCDAVNALFGVDGAFNDAAIGYHAVAASAASAAYAIEHAGRTLPGIECWSFDAQELGQADGKAAAKGRAFAALERRSVAYLAALLQDATLHHGDGRSEPLAPRHVAVLVNSNREADAMQAALARAGIPAVSNLQASVYTSEEAADLALLLAALADPADADRARAAWASRLVGKDAAVITASLAGSDASPQIDVTRWADTVRRHGVLAWLHGLLASAAPRLLERPDGTRRVANYLQLAELLQAEQAAGFGLADLAARFARSCVDAGSDSDADADRLRLETDADAVTVSTVHAAKGLEYAVVILPYAGFGRAPDKRSSRVSMSWYHDGDGTARVALGPATDAVLERARDEALAEDLRKLYVAITRAKALCVLPWGRVNEGEHGALHHLLHCAGHAEALAFDDADCRAALDALQARAADGAVGIAGWNNVPQAARLVPPARAAKALAAARFDRQVERDWTVWSFSQLVRGRHNQAGETAPGAGDDDADDGVRLGGARFGTTVHAVFEHTDFAQWRDAQGVPGSQRTLIENQLAAQGLPGATLSLSRAVDFVGDLVRAALTTPLACGTRIADLAADAHRAEIEFHLALAPADSPRLYALLHEFGYQRQRERIAPERLAGLLTGKIDLTFLHDGKYYLVDWKTNRCPPYDDAALAAEIARHDYDLQWLVYTLALHRWLGSVLPDYDYARDFGGAYYLFVRGMREGAGVHFDRPDARLVAALDELFPAPRREAA
ncbi:MAG: hypothetical protein EPN40_08650 [Rhodanobacteraceae bacterium]|nr:MAG: hypothetical protein EPN40_08650 [Rhodanobacteraceae bacterium]